MTLRLRILRGASAGETRAFEPPAVSIGRHPDCDFRFDPETDLDVSARHALVRWEDGRWVLYDQGSTNGTFVNGRRTTGAVSLEDGDVIGLGAHGPELHAGIAPSGSPGPAARQTTPSRTAVVRAQVAREMRRLRWIAAALALVLMATVGAFLYAGSKQHADWEMERSRLAARADSILSASEDALAALRGEREGLAEALRASQAELRAVGRRLAAVRESGDSGEVPALRRRLQAATVALQRQQLAAALDVGAIEGKNRPAVAMLYVEYEDGQVATATAFAVRSDATLLTSRHALVGETGSQRARRIGVQFSDSPQVWPARILSISKTADLAAVKVDNIAGNVPTVLGLNIRADTLVAGAPLAMIGYPLGGDVGTGWGGRRARPVVAVGILTALDSAHLELQGYGAAGASGSPLFDATGEVVGVLFGGERNAATPTLLAVPAALAARLLEGLR